MKIFISADIEGVGGVATWEQAGTKGADHKRACQWMTDEVNAAIEGALEGGATEIVVRDAHGAARNIQWESLHPRARLISGWGPTSDMMQGLDDSFGLVFLVGYHPGPANPAGVLAHSFTSRLTDSRLNGAPCNESVIAALQAGVYSVPIGLVTGQAELAEEIQPTIPDCVFVTTKHGLHHQAALLEPQATVRAGIKEGAREAVARQISGGGPEPYKPKPPIRLEFMLSTVEAAAALEGIEGIERVAPGTCVLTADDVETLVKRFFTTMTILYSVRDFR